MLFNSVQFLVFFPVVAVAFFALPHRHRWWWLLAASYVFYMAWRPEYALLILLSTVIDHQVALGIARSTSARTRAALLATSLTTNLGLLFAFKYYGFARAQLGWAGDLLGIPLDLPALNVLLPVGISFYTFQTLSYTIDVYRGRLEPEAHFGRFALYVSFFPQLVAGPIERATHLLPQLRVEQRFDYDRMVSGLKQACWGMFKKVVIADRLAAYVDGVYADPGAQAPVALVVATYLFAFQIYTDFSAYSDIAIGVARVLGFDLMENFRRPYFARDIGEFWRRWHISLSTWFRDYVYIPLGGNRGSWLRTTVNLVIVFVVSGAWHGANWTFLVWGALHAAYLVAERVLARPRAAFAASGGRAAHLVEVLVTFHLVLLAWVFFRARSVTEAVDVLWRGLGGLPAAVGQLLSLDVRGLYYDAVVRAGVGKFEFVASFAVIAVLLAYDGYVERGRPVADTPRGRVARAAWYDALVLAMLVLGVYGQQSFIYFQF